MKKEIYALIIVATFLLGLTIGDLTRHHNPTLEANVFVCIDRIEGSEDLYSGNVITDIGEHYVANIIGWNNVTNHNETKWIATGNSTIAQTKTKLDTEATTAGFTRALATISNKWISGGDVAVNYTYKFTSTASITVNAVALHWNGVSNSDNNCFALAAITQTTFPTGSNMTVVWSIIYNGN